MSDPWFKFYPSDWLSGTRGLTPAETGVYITLVCMMYENDGQLMRGGAKQDARLARRCGCTFAAFKKIINNLIVEKKLTDHNGALSNRRVQKELNERMNRVQKASDAAQQKWAKARRNSEQNQSNIPAPTYPSHSASDANYQNQNQKTYKKSSNGYVKAETPLQRVSRNIAAGQNLGGQHDD
ncbi:MULTISPECIES: DUF1376 domain-containing protein [unclassified Lentilitoribacter]|uniref:DUF1376 domain-containing protein n=1 Tax=unclassified Lentilitoribacter TaxID=2647570 RepID=UPI0013A6B80D|nr:DUF1376 domain-containing protein [Lentilitoribacter sp. Alg239-R112]